MIKHTVIAAMLVSGVCGAFAQSDNTMYLVKGDRVVAKYNVDDVDYVSFDLPEGVIDDPLWVTIENAGKNTITYTIHTESPTDAYAHALVSYWDANYVSLDNFAVSFEELSEENQKMVLQALVPYSGYAGQGTNTYTQTDNASDGNGSVFVVTPGTKYYVCAWEIEPVSQAPLDAFAWEEVSTIAPGVSPATIEVKYLRENAQGIAFEINGSEDVDYVVTAWGLKDNMEFYFQVYGEEMLWGMFGQRWTLSYLNSYREDLPDIENATWPVYDSGEYVLYVRAYDRNGDLVSTSCGITYEAPEAVGPQITVFSREKGNGSVSFNFEISPSNVDAAYVRLMPENDVDDQMNAGYTLAELAQSSKAIDITSQINSIGEYTFTANGLDEQWYSIIVYAEDSDGSIARRYNFFPDEESEWSDYEPNKVPKRIKVRNVKSHRPTFNKVK